MTTSSLRNRRGGRARASARSVRGGMLEPFARIGFTARGLMYILIGLLALAIAVDRPAPVADRTGALEEVANHPFGELVLWLLVVGFAAMALWRFAQAYYGVHRRIGRGRRGMDELFALVRGIVYTIFFIGALRFATGSPAPATTDQDSQDFTTSALQHGFGRFLVVLVGIAIAAVGLMMIKIGLTRSFRKDLRLRAMSRATRRGVERLGVIGNTARGLVFAGIGVFMISAAVTEDPARAKGVDQTLRSFAHTPAGPVLLVLVAIGLILFGVYSLAEARWHRSV